MGCLCCDRSSSYPPKEIEKRIARRIYDLLSNEEDIYGTEVEFVVEWKGCEPVICGMHASIKLQLL